MTENRHLHFARLNEHIGVETMNAVRAVIPNEGVTGGCVAAASSFGFSGTNAHCVLKHHCMEIVAEDWIGDATVSAKLNTVLLEMLALFRCWIIESPAVSDLHREVFDYSATFSLVQEGSGSCGIYQTALRSRAIPECITFCPL